MSASVDNNVGFIILMGGNGIPGKDLLLLQWNWFRTCPAPDPDDYLSQDRMDGLSLE